MWNGGRKMSEKRFVVRKITRDERPKLFSSVGADYKYFIVDTKRHNTGEKWFDLELRFNFGIDSILADKVCELLNSLSEENEVLKKKLESLQKVLHIVECCDKDE